MRVVIERTGGLRFNHFYEILLVCQRTRWTLARPRLHNRQGSRSIDCLLPDGSQAARHRACPVLRSPLLRCERFRSRRLQSRGGLQELATPPIIKRRSRRRKSNPRYVLGFEAIPHGMISNDAILSPSTLKQNRRSTALPGKLPTRW